MEYVTHCYICGRFTSWSSDYSIPFGGPMDFEPPPEEYFCEKCAEEQKKRHIESGWLPSNWVPAKWEIEAAKEMRMWRAGHKGAAWSRWYPIDKELPENYEWHTIVGFEEFTPTGVN